MKVLAYLVYITSTVWDEREPLFAYPNTIGKSRVGACKVLGGLLILIKKTHIRKPLNIHYWKKNNTAKLFITLNKITDVYLK